MKLATLILFLSCITLHASLVFKETTKTISPKPFERKLEVAFPFTNTGDKAISVFEVKTGCGCCSANKLKQTKYAAGESGEITVTYRPKGKSDTQKITVMTSDPENRSYELKLNVRMKPLLNISPKQVMWKVGEEAKAKVMKVSIGYKDEPVNITGVTSQSKDFTVELKEAGENFELLVTPKDTSRMRIGKISIQTDYPKEKPMSVKVYARVK